MIENRLLSNLPETPREHYIFMLSPEPLEAARKKYLSVYIKNMLLSIALCILTALCGIRLGEGVIGLGVSMLMMSLAAYSKAIRAHNKAYAQSKEKLSETVYEYLLYDDFLLIVIASDTGYRQMKVPLRAIDKLENVCGHLAAVIEGHLYMIPMSVLPEDSYFMGRYTASKTKKTTK